MKPQMVIITHVENRAVCEGFIPASLKLGYEVILITDHSLDHKHFFSRVASGPKQIIECDVFNPLSIIDLLNTCAIKPQVVFSNSDHLQAACALVASYFGCPGKNWQICYQAKNKAQMRAKLQRLKIPSIWSNASLASSPLPENINYPVIAKPREGVASMGVVLCRTPAELQDYQNNVTKQHLPMLLEYYLDGPLFTLETLSDGQQMIAVGGFDVTLSPLPYFIETGAIWNGPNSVLYREQALGQVRKFGVNFGVCHSEFIVTPTGPVLVEINYRSIGDGREFLLNKLLPFNWFEKIIMLHAGESLAVLDTESKSALIQYFPNAEKGFLAQSPESFDTQQGETEISYKALKKSGQHLTVSNSNKDYLGMLTVIGETASSIKKAANQVAKQLAWEIN